MEKAEIRNDDIFIYENLTSSMKRADNIKPMFKRFIEVDKWFEERNIPMILTVLADGIDHYPEWVAYIKERKHRYRIELHGHTHVNFRHITDENELYNLLMPAKERVERTFGAKVTRWFPPFSKRGFPGGTSEVGTRVCERMGIQFHTKGNGKIPHRYFHFWRTPGVEKTKEFVQNKEIVI